MVFIHAFMDNLPLGGGLPEQGICSKLWNETNLSVWSDT